MIEIGFVCCFSQGNTLPTHTIVLMTNNYLHVIMEIYVFCLLAFVLLFQAIRTNTVNHLNADFCGHVCRAHDQQRDFLT